VSRFEQRFRSRLGEQPMPELNPEGIDFRAASEFFRPIRKLTRHELETPKLVTWDQGRIVPTIGGVLLFGADRLRHFPDAWTPFQPSAMNMAMEFSIGQRLEGQKRASHLRQPQRAAIDYWPGIPKKPFEDGDVPSSQIARALLA
jgi:hypothetical protein